MLIVTFCKNPVLFHLFIFSATVGFRSIISNFFLCFPWLMKCYCGAVFKPGFKKWASKIYRETDKIKIVQVNKGPSRGCLNTYLAKSRCAETFNGPSPNSLDHVCPLFLLDDCIQVSCLLPLHLFGIKLQEYRNVSTLSLCEVWGLGTITCCNYNSAYLLCLIMPLSKLNQTFSN